MLEKEREEEQRQLRLQFEERERVAREEHTTREQRLLERVQKLKSELKCDARVALRSHPLRSAQSTRILCLCSLFQSHFLNLQSSSPVFVCCNLCVRLRRERESDVAKLTETGRSQEQLAAVRLREVRERADRDIDLLRSDVDRKVPPRVCLLDVPRPSPPRPRRRVVLLSRLVSPRCTRNAARQGRNQRGARVSPPLIKSWPLWLA